MNIQPLFNLVLVELIENHQTESGLNLPEGYSERVKAGKVLAVGRKAEEVKVGDSVTFPRNVGLKLKAGLLMKESDILAVLK